MPKFTHIKLTKSEVKLKWLSDDPERDDHLTAQLVSGADPDPEFPQVMQSLKEDVLRLLEMPASYGEGMDVRSVNFQHKEGSWACTISIVKGIKASNGPLNITTPQLRQSADGMTEGVGLIPSKLEEKLKVLMRCADDFRRRKRAQGELALPGANGHDGDGEDPDLTPIEAAAAAAEAEAAENGERTYRAGELPSEEDPDGDDAGEEVASPTPDAEQPDITPEGTVSDGILEGLPVVEHKGQRIVLPFDPADVAVGALEGELQEVYLTAVIDALEATDRRKTAAPIYATRRKYLEKHTNQAAPIANPHALPLETLAKVLVNAPADVIRKVQESDKRADAARVYEDLLDRKGEAAIKAG